MKKLEITFILIFLMGMIFRILSIVGSNTLIFFSLAPLSLFYFFFSFAFLNRIKLKQILKNESYSNTSHLRLVFTIVLGFCFSSFTLGILYKLLYWVSAQLVFITGIILLTICLIISIIKFKQNHLIFYKIILIRIFLMLIVGLVSVFV
jgi:hypothetical protein